jgi:transposase
MVLRRWVKQAVTSRPNSPSGASYVGSRGVARDDLEFVRLPAYSPELNPVEECWRQVKRDLSTRFFGSLGELTTAIDDALDQLSVPDVINYF